MMPVKGMEEANREFLIYCDSGMSVMGLNHRLIMFDVIILEKMIETD